MQLQEVLLVGSRVLFASSAVLLGATLRFAVVHDVRGVRHDLSGRRRQKDLESSHRPARRNDASAAYVAPVAEPVTEVAKTVTGVSRRGEFLRAVDEPTVVEQPKPTVALHTPKRTFEVSQEIVLCGTEQMVDEGGVLL